MRTLLCAALLALAPALRAQTAAPAVRRTLDDFESLSAWSAHPAEGVALAIRPDAGRHGRAMRLDFDFKGHGGYAIARRNVSLDLPANYAFSFAIRGESPVNTLEFKLIDSTGDNVWWNSQPSFVFPADWRTVTRRKRHLSFAWGPQGGGEIHHVSAIEIVVTAGQGGQGSVWIDDLTFAPFPPEHRYTLTPSLRASSSAAGHAPALALDGDTSTVWRSASANARQSLTMDFRESREYGGLTVAWVPGAYATDYAVEISTDGASWQLVHDVRGGNGGRDDIPLPETESRYVRLRLYRPGSARPGAPPAYAIRDITVHPVSWSASPNDFYQNVARAAPRGSYPRYLTGEQSYWTVVGANGDSEEALINADGTIEPFRGGFSIEPFLYSDRLTTWNDVRQHQSLADGDLPIPSVTWADESDRPLLEVTAFATDAPGEAALYARYRVHNQAPRVRRITLYLAIRPFQVNPSWQFLNVQGGVSRIDSLGVEHGLFRADSGRVVVPLLARPVFGAATFDQGDIVEFLRAGHLPPDSAVTDAGGRASGALAYELEIPAGGARDVSVRVPWHSQGARATPLPDSAFVEHLREETARRWRSEVDRVTITLPPAGARIVSTLRSQLAYILINRDDAAIQPGSRAYSRSWIRDGSLTSTALLRLGHHEEVRDFIDWYVRYQYPTGNVPCCVDARGADPVPENDSHGELIYLIAEYYRMTRDSAFLARMWPHVAGAQAYIDTLRHQRMTAAYRTPAKRAFYGMLPQSISHEGYSAKPMHSYWDDFFALKGLEDATMVAAVLGKSRENAAFARARDEFRQNLYDSFKLTMAAHKIDFLPGSVELGDFDATSTTIGVEPVGEMARLEPALSRTFERYYRSSRARAAGDSAWDAYTPYELRTVGTFVRLGWKDRAHEMLDFFFQGQRPAAWRQWAEVVYRDPKTPHFIGDMPHTWVGSDFIRSALDLFAYERDADSSLVLGAGILDAWVTAAPGVAVRGLRTHYGPLEYTMRAEGDSVRVRVARGLTVPRGGIIIRSPLARPPKRATVNGAAVRLPAREVVVRRLPTDVVFRY